jgi:Protein of unknown function (DUF2948)
MAEARDLLRLAALDSDDLQIISVQMQDAILKVANIKYLPRQRKVALVANRFDWDHAQGRLAAPYRRRLAGLQFTTVKSMKSRGIRQHDGDAVLELLSISFEPRQPPGGDIVLCFAGGGDLRLEVECIEAQLQDLGPEWETAAKPIHDTTDAR